MNVVPDAFRANPEVMAGCPVVLLAGGQGTRLHELTDDTCKPAVRFGNHARIVDFAMGNALNSGVRHVIAATQYRPDSLSERLVKFWQPVFQQNGGTVDLRYGPGVTGTSDGYTGTAAAVAENIARIDALAPDHVLILAADHVYRMNYARMLQTHRQSGADMTIAAAAVPRTSASAFGIIDADENGRIVDFLEKPADPPAMKGDPERAFASMGIYVFRWAALRDALLQDMADEGSGHDFGFDLVPKFVAAQSAVVHRLQSPVSGIDAYWRDVGTLDAYREAHLDLLCERKNLHGAEARWPILPAVDGAAPALGGPASAGELKPHGAVQSFVAAHSLIGSGARLRRSVLMQGSIVGAGSRLTNCIVAPDATIDPGMVIGEDPEEDARWFRRSQGGTTLVTSQMLAARRRAAARLVSGMRIGAREPGQPVDRLHKAR